VEDVSPRQGETRPGRGSLSLFVRYWLPPLLVYGFITFLSSIPGQNFPSVLPGWSIDKVVHFFEYAPVGGLLVRALLATTRLSPMAALATATLITLGLGSLDEVHQYFVPNRQMDWRDATADTIGGFLGGVAMLLWLRLRPARS
jgi:VanZ family protein